MFFLPFHVESDMGFENKGTRSQTYTEQYEASYYLPHGVSNISNHNEGVVQF